MNAAAVRDDFALIFPGQGAQAVGMMDALDAEFACVRARFDSASQVLGFDLWQLVAHGPEEVLNRTEHTQPALLAASVATFDAWRELGGPLPGLVAGHSFGEYSALVCAGALEFTSAIALVAARGRYMQEAVPAGQGAMAAILGLEQDALAAICAAHDGAGAVCACANLNAPGQIVIAGSVAAVEAACADARAAGAKRALRLAVSVPAHCALMQPAAARLAARLAEVEVAAPHLTVLHNVDVAAHREADAIRTALVQQLHSPVRWIETIERMRRDGVIHIGECGPGKVLAALVKRIDRDLAVTSLGARSDLVGLLQSLHGARP